MKGTRFKKIRFACISGLAGMLLLAVASPTLAAPLYGVTGDGGSNPETLYTISTLDASANVVTALGNGDGGESIAFNPTDGLMYHWSGFGTQVMETINLSTNVVTNIVNGYGGTYNPGEVTGSTYAGGNTFLTTDLNGNLASVTAGGAFTLIGPVPNGLDEKALDFLGSTLYAGDKNSNALDTINPLTGASTGSIGVTLAGNPVDGIVSLTSDSGVLYGVIKNPAGSPGTPGTRQLVTINTVTGAAANLGTLPNGISNIEFAAVPAPSALLLFGTGLAGVVAWRLRTKRRD